MCVCESVHMCVTSLPKTKCGSVFAFQRVYLGLGMFNMFIRYKKILNLTYAEIINCKFYFLFSSHTLLSLDSILSTAIATHTHTHPPP